MLKNILYACALSTVVTFTASATEEALEPVNQAVETTIIENEEGQQPKLACTEDEEVQKSALTCNEDEEVQKSALTCNEESENKNESLVATIENNQQGESEEVILKTDAVEAKTV